MLLKAWRICTLTQYIDEVLKRKEAISDQEEEDSISFIEVRFKDGKWHTDTTGYKSGKVVRKFNDKRKKEEIEWN